MKKKFSFSALILVSLVTDLTLAQEEDVEVLDELVVYGSKLGETVNETTDSVGKVDAERLEKSDVRTAGDAFRLLGNVRAPQFADGGIVIRGINSQAPDAENISGQQAPLSSIFVDGVALTQQSSFRGPMGLWDVESLEVFRGPQSTLQGKNSLAGAVVIKTRDPDFDWGGAVRGTYGEFNQRELALMLNMPLSDEWALRFTYENRERDSFVDAPNLRAFSRFDDFNTSVSEQFRAKLLFEPENSSLRSLLTYGYSDVRPTNSDVFGPNADSSVNDFFDRLWLSSSSQQQIRETQTQILSWENTLELSDTLKLTSLSTFIDTELKVGRINGDLVRDEGQRDITQEVRLNWDDDWGRAVLGVYGSLQDADSTLNRIDSRRVNMALFGQFDYALTDSLYLIVGGRLNYDEFEFENVFRPEGIGTDDLRLLPKVGVRYEFDDSHSIGIVAQQGYRSGGSGIQLDGSSFVFDPSLTNNLELSWRGSFLDDKLTVSANVFYTDWSDQQVTVRNVDLTTFEADERVINAADSSLYGGELELTYEATDSLTFRGSLGLLSTSYDDFSFRVDAPPGIPGTLDFGGYDFPESPTLNFSLGANYEHECGFFVAADLVYSSSYYSPVLFAPVASGAGSVSVQVPQDSAVEIDPSLVFNLSLGYQADDWRFTVFAQNLFGEDAIVGQIPQAVNGANGPEFRDDFLATLGPPRFFGASLEFTF